MPDVQKVPEGYSTLTPSLSVNGAAKAIELFKKAFNAKEEERMSCEDGKIMHATLSIGSSKIFISDSMQDMPPTVSSFYMYLDNVDAAIKTAKDAGMQEAYPVTDMFWGDRVGTLKDPFGNYWSLATHVREVSREEMEKGGKQYAQMCREMGQEKG